MKKFHIFFLLLGSVALTPAGAQVSETPGPTDNSCTSSFRVGYSNCTPSKPEPIKILPIVEKDKPPANVQPVQAKPPSGPTEAEIDAYIANHGKPSRESARALLDPTDENIAAMARSIRQQAAVASYVASRMTNLQQVDPGLTALNPAFASEDLPMLSGMRIVLHVALGCRECERAAMVLQKLVAESPVLDARVVVHRAADLKEFTLELGRMGLTLPASMASPELAKFAKAVPIAVLADLRYGRESFLRAFGTTQEVRSTIASFRKQSIELSATK